MGDEAGTCIQLLQRGLVQPTEMELWICRADGSNMRQITNLGGANWAPYFHPDGEHILFSSNHKTKAFPFNIFTTDIHGAEPVQITFDNAFDSFPMFSPDGKRIAFSSNRNNGRTVPPTSLSPTGSNEPVPNLRLWPPMPSSSRTACSASSPSQLATRSLSELGDFPKDVYPIGRLDRDSEGLLLLTDDNDLKRRILEGHGGRKIWKTYHDQVEGTHAEDLRSLERPMQLKAKERCSPPAPQGPDVAEPHPTLGAHTPHPVSGQHPNHLGRAENRRGQESTGAPHDRRHRLPHLASSATPSATGMWLAHPRPLTDLE